MKSADVARYLEREKAEACEARVGRIVKAGDKIVARIEVVMTRNREAEFAGEEFWCPVAFVYLTPFGRSLVELPWSLSL